MNISEVRVIVTCPGRNYVVVKMLTDEPGLYGVGDALPSSKHELAQQQPQAKSNDQSRSNKSQHISPVERLNTGIA